MVKRASSLFAAMTIALLGWWLLFLVATSGPLPRSLELPPDKEIVVALEATIDTRSAEENAGTTWKATGILRGKPRPVVDGVSYTCLWDRLTIMDAEGRTLLAFERLPGPTYLYRSDPRLSDAQRTAIFEAFHIDTSNEAANADRSLLQERLDVMVERDGRITEIAIAAPLRNAIHAKLAGSPFRKLVEQLLSQPEQLPPLFTCRGNERCWQTDGTLLVPITVTHTVKTAANAITTVSSHTASTSTADHRGITLDWMTDWDYDEYSRTIPQLSSQLKIELANTLFGSKESACLHANIAAKITFAPHTQAIADRIF